MAAKSKKPKAASKAKAAPKTNAPARTDTVTLTDNSSGKSWEMPTLSGTIGPRVIDVRRLYADTGFFTYDPGYTSTASCDSEITYIDGDEGILMHRGYSI